MLYHYSRHALATRRVKTQAGLVAVLILTASAALSAVASSGAPPSTSAHTRTVQGTRPAAAFPLVGNGVANIGAGGTGSQAGAQATAAKPKAAAATTMSMDAPIQHGLTAHQEQAISARLLERHQDAGAAARSQYWTPAMGHTAVVRAESWLGMPYSWAAGSASGPTSGRCEPGSGGDLDCHVVGFDCSGLMMYAWGAYASLPHLAATQLGAGAFHPTLKQLQPGDLVFFAGYLPGGVGHVAIYTGHGMVIEAPESGSVIHRAALSSVLAGDGAYRGAVRPLTGATPTLSVPRTAVPSAGGIVTLSGRHLGAVDAVHFGGATILRFTRHTDSVISFRAPAHRAGALAVTVSTSWKAQSSPVALTYARPVTHIKTTPTTSAPKSTGPRSTAPKTTAPTTPVPKSTAPKTTAPKAPSVPKSSVPSSPASGTTTSTAPSATGDSVQQPTS